MGRNWAGSIVTILAFVCAEGRANAQVLKAQILGTVSDKTGAVVQGAKVSLTETATNLSRTAETNESGNYVFVNLDPGVYRVEVEHAGFSKAVRSDINLQPNTTARANFELTPGAVAEVVDVSAAAAPLLQTDRADTGGKIEQVQLQSMPLLFNRNYQGLLVLIPGVGRPFRPHSVFYNSQDSLSVRVNGQGRQFNNFQIEGIENKIDNGNLTALVPPPEAIQTVDISTSNFDPEFGNAGGAVTNVTLRSGTNQFHGSLFHFHRDDAMQARNTFALSKAHTVYNQFGGTLGGRIIRDKMFIFGDFQGSRDRLGQVNLVTIPGAAFRRGDLSSAAVTIYDPATGNAGTGRTPFADRRIPANRISPIAARILSFVPEPNLVAPEGQQNFDKNTVLEKSLNQFDIKYDWVLSSNDRLAVRYSYQKANVFDPGLFGPDRGIYGGPHGGGFSGGGPARTQSPGITFSKVFSPTFVWESRFGAIRNRNDAINLDRGSKISEEIGIRGVNLDEWTSGLSEIRINGYSSPIVGYSPSLPWARSVTTFGIVNNFSKTFQNHIMRFGFDIRRERNDLLQTQTFNPRGRFEYAEGQTGDSADTRRSFANAFASFLLDQPSNAGRDLAIQFPTRREINYNVYLQDKWTVNSKLTLDLGLRYEIQKPGRPRFPGGYSNYNTFNNTLELAGIGNIPITMGVNTNFDNFGPRIGISYRFNDKTVVRTGYGISYIPRRTGQQGNFPILQNFGYPAASGLVSSAVTMTTGFPAPQIFAIPQDGIIRNPSLTSTYGNTPLFLPVGYVQSWNFAVQRALPGNFAADVAYVGNHGVNNQSEFNMNASMIPGSGNNGRPLFQAFRRTADVITYLGTHTSYHSVQAKLDRRFRGGFMLTTAYTFSKGINFAEDNGGIPTPLAIGLNRAQMEDNRRHSFVQSYLFELPFGKGRRFLNQGGAGSWLMGGWQIQGILSMMTGNWLSPSVTASLLNAPGNAARPNWVSPIRYLGNAGPGQKFFDPSSFTIPAQNALGNAGRNIIQGPGIVNADVSIFRDFKVREGMEITFRAESFNMSNTPHFNNPNNNVNSPQFGEINGAAQDQRQFQLGMTFRF